MSTELFKLQKMFTALFMVGINFDQIKVDWAQSLDDCVV